MNRKKIISLAVLAATSAAFSLAFVFMSASRTADLGIIRARFSIAPAANGETLLEVYPFGEVSAKTHSAPVKIIVGLERIHEESIDEIIADGVGFDDLLETMKDNAQKAVGEFILVVLALAAVGGAAGASIGRRIRLIEIILGAGIGLASAAALGAVVISQYQLDAFRQPTYRGLITYAPEIVDNINRSVEGGRNLRKYVRDMAANMSSFYVELDRYSEKENAGRIRILHISDIHNNPLAGDFVKVLVKGLSPDLIMNTGDMTDMGTALELKLMDSLKGISKPHFFVSGNHDSPEVVEELKRDFGLRVLDGDIAAHGKLRIIGFGDPKANVSFDAEVDPEAMLEAAGMIAEKISKMRKRPDVLMIHNPDIGRAAAGLSPVILSGHAHSIRAERIGGSVLIVAGTTGAAGARYIETEEKPSYSAALITLHVDEDGAFVFDHVDLIRMNQSTGEFVVERKFLPIPEEEPEEKEVSTEKEIQETKK